MKIKINEKSFYVITECVRDGHTLCVAAEPWGKSDWGRRNDGQEILDVADNRNPESLTNKWFKGLPEAIKTAMKTVRITTNDENSDGTGLLKQTEMFVPSISEWMIVSTDIRKTISKDNVLWTRSFRGIACGYYSAWCIEKKGIKSYYGVTYLYEVVPAFFLENNVLNSLLAEQNQTEDVSAVSETGGNVKTKRLHITMAYTYVGDTGIDIPIELLKGKTEEEQLQIAYEYAQDHIDEIPVAENAEYIANSDTFEPEDIDWENEEE